MSRRMLQVVGAFLLVLTVGIISCQGLFEGTTGLPTADRSIR